ncbi:hypothetical protein I2485_15390, partial [Nesterenkonia sp. E16_7]|nr:hypothetical protein [Nesterenkonia sp. E16_7]
MTFVSRRDRRRQAKPSLAKAVASNAGTVGRGAAAAVAASGLVISSGVAANASTDIDTPEVTTLDVTASGLSVERASTSSSVAVSASTDGELFFDRPMVTSTPAPVVELEPAPTPDPEPAPEPAPAPVVEEAQEVVPASMPMPTEQEAPAPQAEPAPQEQQSSTGQQGGDTWQAQSSSGQQTSQGNTQVASSAPSQEESPAS